MKTLLILLKMFIFSCVSHADLEVDIKKYNPNVITSALFAQGQFKYDFYNKNNLPLGANEHVKMPKEMQAYFLKMLRRGAFVEFSGYPAEVALKLKDSYVDYLGEIILIDTRAKERYRIQFKSLDSVVITLETNNEFAKIIKQEQYIWASSEQELSELLKFWRLSEIAKNAKSWKLDQSSKKEEIEMYLMSEYQKIHQVTPPKFSIREQREFFKEGLFSYLSHKIKRQTNH